jgi:DNA processing protein
MYEAEDSPRDSAAGDHGMRRSDFVNADGTADAAQTSLLAKLRLSMTSGIGPRLTQLLLTRFETAEAIFRASEDELQSVPGIGPKLSTEIIRARTEVDPAAELRLCRERGIAVVARDTPQYPRWLAEIPDPPTVMFVQGTIKPQDAVAVAIVGSRHATSYGIQTAQRLAEGLARAGVTVVSGLARGIDAAAHRGALEAGGRTFAVLGSGLGKIYPPEHKDLALEIVQSGALISESAVLTEPVAGAFPQRNRVIAGLSLGVIVVEAAFRSGALITARHAYEQNRDVFAVPGRIDSNLSHGCHQLLRDGAKLVESVDDILEELGPLPEAAQQPNGPPVHKPAELLLNANEKLVLQAIGENRVTTVDELIACSGLAVAQVLTTISVLEMRRLVTRVSGNSVMRL